LSYYLNTKEFISNLVSIPSSNVNPSSSNSSKYLAGRATLYDATNQQVVGTCSATFLCLRNENIFVDISNYISLTNGLIVSWFTPTNPINLEIDSLLNGLVTEAIVTANTKIGQNPYFGMEFNLFVSSSNGKIYFNFQER